MAICEDAPCCGCCGASVWAAEARAEAEWREEAMYDQLDAMDDYMDSMYDGADDEEDDEDGEPIPGPGSEFFIAPEDDSEIVG